jgi:hypothetical protein
MNFAAEMLRHTPTRLAFPNDLLVACIEACFDCTQACTSCADSDLGEDSVVELRRCIATCLNCADVCSSAGSVLSRPWGYEAALTRAILETCRLACAQCAEECERHAHMHEHCRVCAEACRRCEHACDALLA